MDIIESYHTHTSNDLSQKYNVSASLVTKIWSQNGLIGKLNNIYNVNHQYFKEINSKDKAYWLGWLAADGCVYCRKSTTYMIKLCLGIKDKEILKLFNQSLNYNKPVAITPKTATVEIISKEMFNDLSKYNIIPRKSGVYRMPKIRQDLMHHFIRGYFDGDGSISKSIKETPSGYSVSICGYFLYDARY